MLIYKDILDEPKDHCFACSPCAKDPNPDSGWASAVFWHHSFISACLENEHSQVPSINQGEIGEGGKITFLMVAAIRYDSSV